jgi:hypothetical protein
VPELPPTGRFILPNGIEPLDLAVMQKMKARHLRRCRRDQLVDLSGGRTCFRLEGLRRWAEAQQRRRAKMRQAERFHQMIGVRSDPRHVIGAEVFDANDNDIDARSIRRELATRVE